MNDRPDPGHDAPDGYEFVAVIDDGWRVGGDPDRHCRWMAKGRSCGAPSVASFNRPQRTKFGQSRPVWWFYCAEHMYGRWIEGGQVMHWNVRAIEPA